MRLRHKMPVPPILWCSVSGKTSPASTKHEVQSASISQPRRTRSSPRVPAVASTVFEEDNFTRIARACASARHSTELWKHDVLKVFFLKKSKENVKKSTLLTKWKLDEETIMEWANRWSSQKDCMIPVFELCMRESEADIIVELNDQGRIQSQVGCVEAGGKPTMWLDFSKGFPEYHEHVVVHEFGHALGLEHEHQRSDFWEKIEPFIDTNKMKEDLPEGRYKDYTQPIPGLRKSTKYDPQSVMHYWFKREWLKEEFGNMGKVRHQRKLLAVSESEKEALLGVHYRDQRRGCVRHPSEGDFKFLHELYNTASLEQDLSASSDEENSDPKVHDFEPYKQKALLSDKEARVKIEQLRTKYNNLRTRLCKHLHREGVKDTIRETLASLCGEDLQYLPVYDELRNEENVEGFYKVIESSLLYLDFNGLLDQLIQCHGSFELKKDAESYRADLLMFLGRTTVKQASNPNHPWWPAQHSDFPKNFTEVKTLVLENPEKVRLIDLIGYRMRFTSEVRLSHLLFLILGVKELNSFVVSWLVPTTIVPLLRDAMGRVAADFFEENKISSVSVVQELILYSETVKQHVVFPSTGTIEISQNASTTTSAAFVKRTSNASKDKLQESVATGSLEKKGVASLVPCIREKLGQRLRDSGFEKAAVVLGKYLELDQNEANFREWLRESCGANNRQQQECCQCLQEWCQTNL